MLLGYFDDGGRPAWVTRDGDMLRIESAAACSDSRCIVELLRPVESIPSPEPVWRSCGINGHTVRFDLDGDFVDIDDHLFRLVPIP